uniref:Uncharacterized protein n=1 Tax=Arundo donax TaxID=35708 RepID=A0A0A9BRY9_ARUDO
MYMIDNDIKMLYQIMRY